MIKVTEDKLLEILETSNEDYMIFFKGNDCGVCKAIEFQVNQLIEKGDIKFPVYLIDITSSPKIQGKFLIFTIPSFIVMSNKREIYKEIRVMSLIKFKNFLQKYNN